LAVFVKRADGSDGLVAEIRTGSIVGEMSLISGEPRSATVRALRDSHLYKLSHEAFHAQVVADPPVLLAFTRTLAKRLNRSIHGHSPRSDLSVITVVPAGEPATGHRSFADDLARQFGSSAIVVDSQTVRDHLAEGLDRSALTAFLHAVEREHDLMVLVADEGTTEWIRRCLRHADLNVLVGNATGLMQLGSVESDLATADSGTPVELVILHDEWPNTGTAEMLGLRAVRRHHHIKPGSSADIDRFIRIVSGRSVGLVLSGGGARGFAHLGVMRALLEAEIPIDHIGGASIGSSVAAAYAFGWDWELMYEWIRYVTVDRGTLVDFSFPAISLARGDKLTSGMRQGYGETQIEDAWYEFFCVSTDLTIGGLRVHKTGPLWRAVRASVAIPGIFPPVRDDDGHVLVDGGVLSNLPTAVMADEFSPGTMIAVDLQGTFRLPSADLSSDGVASGWQVAGRRLAPWTNPLETPRILDILSRCSSVSLEDATAVADLVFRPPLDDFGLLEFTAHQAISDAGYRHAAEALEQWDGVTSLQARNARRAGL
ncbi:MAG: patatin-like phospholipase family protein, partial [Acidimicrobiia bacterium]|nr:patatin-like phospholipase family protein [Acidimicrobiia bacterium]